MKLLKRNGNLIKVHPAQILVMGFGSLILIGTILFMLPIATYEEGRGLSFIDTLFEATSAVCVTGLAVSIREPLLLYLEKLFFYV